ncbi:MAG: nucleotidyltransferase family protein [Rhodomicrobium sp.]
MDRATMIERIKAKEEAIRKEGATHLYVFGSRARGDNKPASDVDVYVDYEQDRKFSLLDLAGIKVLLEDELGFDVHITTKSSLRPELKGEIEAQSIRVF